MQLRPTRELDLERRDRHVALTPVGKKRIANHWDQLDRLKSLAAQLRDPYRRQHRGPVMTDIAGRVGAVLERTSARHAGLVVGVRSDAGTAYWHRGRLPDGARSIFEIGSITKVFTATLLADLAREGLVALDDPVQRHLPAGVRMPTRGREITLEDLATHHSGLPRLPKVPKGFLLAAYTRDRRDPYARLDAARLEAAIAATRPRREPGRRFSYSNYGMGLLGYVLALRAGTSYQGSCARVYASR